MFAVPFECLPSILACELMSNAHGCGYMPPREAVLQACVIRFRPILMTTMAALFAAIPLVVAAGPGSELRRPLGITIIGGLIVSQLLTLYTTPVIYMMIDKLRGRRPAPAAQAGAVVP